MEGVSIVDPTDTIVAGDIVVPRRHSLKLNPIVKLRTELSGMYRSSNHSTES
jgi:hypothetical protein